MRPGDARVRGRVPPSTRHVSCRIHNDVVTIDLDGDGQSEMLFLTRVEATTLTERLEQEVIGAVADEIVVADVCLTKQEAWQLVDAIEAVLSGTGETGAAMGSQRISWLAEGF